MPVGINDLARLTVELGERNITDGGVWAERAGIEPEALLGAIDAVITAVRLKVEEQIVADLSEADTDEGVAFVKVELSDILGQACANALVLGWEIRDQFGKPRGS